MDRVLPSEGRGCWFDPSQAHHLADTIAAVLAALLLAACAAAPTSPVETRPIAPPAAERDGPEALPPPGLASVPDPEPRVEAIRSGGPNKPYEVLGRAYVPMTDDRAFTERGLASWYGRKFHGRRTASGEVYNMYEMTAAHPTLPIPSYARVRNPANGREVVLRINDRGPFHPGRIVDLSYTAALKLDLLRGVAPVELERITPDEIRSGAWRRDGGATQSTAAAPAAPSAVAAAPAIEPVAPSPAAEPPRRAYTAQAQGFWVQLGAFRDRSGAEALQRRAAIELDWLAPLLAIFNETPLHRVQAGPYAERGEAQGAAQRIRQAMQLAPLVVERR